MNCWLLLTVDTIMKETTPLHHSHGCSVFILFIAEVLPTEYQGVTKRCRLSLLTNSTLVIRVQMRGSCGVSANEYSCAHHVTWSPNKLWRSTPYLTLCRRPSLTYSSCSWLRCFYLRTPWLRSPHQHLFTKVTCLFILSIVKVLLS
jgi:hypothetical protein